jgi:hypothetical protein
MRRSFLLVEEVSSDLTAPPMLHYASRELGRLKKLEASNNCRILMRDGGTDVRAGFGSIFWGDFMSP